MKDTVSWELADEHARVLLYWHQDQTLFQGDLQKRISYATTHRLAEKRWSEHRAVLALLLWRSAVSRGCPLDNVPLSDAIASAECALRDGGLPDDPMPEKSPWPDPSWSPSPKRITEALETAHSVLDTVHARPGVDRLGYRVLDLRAQPHLFFSRPGYGGWHASRSLARSDTQTATEHLRGGKWTVSDDDRRAAETALISLRGPAVFDYPSTPARGDEGWPSWLQCASWLSSLAPALRAAAALVPRDAEGYIAPLDHVLSSYAGLCGELQHAVTVLDPQWAANLALSSSEWESAHVPESLKEQTSTIETQVAQIRDFLTSLVLQ